MSEITPGRDDVLNTITELLQNDCDVLQHMLETRGDDDTSQTEAYYLSEIQKCRAIMKYVNENLK